MMGDSCELLDDILERRLVGALFARAAHLNDESADKSAHFQNCFVLLAYVLRLHCD